jgi:membrane protein DedA with SNARE-associated domain
MMSFLQSYGLPVLFLLVMAESSGIPVPGETALITAGLLASRGHFNIAEVVAVAAVAAIVGDNIGYALGRTGGRKLLFKWDFIGRHAEKHLPTAERFFEKHGGKTVFFARFIAGLRVFGAWVAGMTRMHWLSFLAWNAAGGICWALAFGLGTYYLGKAAVDYFATGGLIAFGVGIAVALVALFLVRRRRQKRSAAAAEPE